MEEESSLPHYSIVQFPIPGMESVVATVSGYHGSERFQLIKLISRSGASYVGTMNRSTTHLVCWKHEGRKYELAKEFGNFIVNHRWVEECVKQGRHVPEKPYLLESGQEVGPLVLEVPVVNERVRKLPPYQYPHKVLERSELDMDPELDSHVAGAHSWFLNEGMISECGPSNNKSYNINKKDGRHSNHVCSTSRHYKKHVLHEPENEEPFSPSTLLPSEQRRSLAKPESHHKVRRLVKKNVIDLDSEEGSRPIGVADQLDGLITRSSGSNKRRDKKRLRHRVISDDEFVDCKDVNESSQEMPHIHIPKDSNVQSGVASFPMESTSLDLCPNANEITKAKISRLAESTDLSCVICWTNFSSTRGVLPCGHRFCFSCIQSWADVMVTRGKASTCPLCKASFSSITKVDDASSLDQKIFSQTIPCNSSIKDIFILPGDEGRTFGPQPEPNPACSECSFREPEDLLVKCHLCQVRCVHSYCLDPPLLPWTCIHCKDLQMMYRHLY